MHKSFDTTSKITQKSGEAISPPIRHRVRYHFCRVITQPIVVVVAPSEHRQKPRLCV